MDSGHYVCDVLDYNTGTWWRCDDDTTIKNYSGYPDNVYNDFSHESEPKKGGNVYYEGMRYDFVIVIHKGDILASTAYSFCTGE